MPRRENVHSPEAHVDPPFPSQLAHAVELGVGQRHGSRDQDMDTAFHATQEVLLQAGVRGQEAARRGPDRAPQVVPITENRDR